MTDSLPKIASDATRVAGPPIVELNIVGDGRPFVRTLARLLVRRELISAGLIADPDRCEHEAAA